MNTNGTTLVSADGSKPAAIESALVSGDLAKLTVEERILYYMRTCESLGLNPLTKPFEYITLNGKLTLYARRDATDQIRKIHDVSISIVGREQVGDVYVVTARATLPSGRTDESTGAVTIAGLKGENLANAYLKCETKAKRRVTLSIIGLGMLDETEVETIPTARAFEEPSATSVAMPQPVAAPAESLDVDAEAADFWCARLDTAPDVESLDVIRAECKASPLGVATMGVIAKRYKACRVKLEEK